MGEDASTNNRQPIDVVIAWVDGGDVRLAEKRNRFLKGNGGNDQPGADPTRFASINEIKYCVLSILKFAPFVRNIFIITDGQNPNLNEDIKSFFPEKFNSVKIIDHKEIFEGFEKFLPTFNSISIGNMIWRVKGLAEQFIYFNDDIFLIRPVKPEDWFIDNLPVLRGKWLPAPVLRIFWQKLRKFFQLKILKKTTFKQRASFHMGQWHSAALVGLKYRYFSNSHTPHTVGLNLVEDFFSKNKSILEKNLSFRFRDHSQFTFISLSNHLQLKNGNRNIAKPDMVYLKPLNNSVTYITKKIKQCERRPSIKYICAQSLELGPKEGQDKLFEWLNKKLEITK